jgi:hypothetical protein
MALLKVGCVNLAQLPPIQMADGIRATSWGAAVYFITLLVGGVWIVLNVYLV